MISIDCCFVSSLTSTWLPDSLSPRRQNLRSLWLSLYSLILTHLCPKFNPHTSSIFVAHLCSPIFSLSVQCVILSKVGFSIVLLFSSPKTLFMFLYPCFFDSKSSFFLFLNIKLTFNSGHVVHFFLLKNKHQETNIKILTLLLFRSVHVCRILENLNGTIFL